MKIILWRQKPFGGCEYRAAKLDEETFLAEKMVMEKQTSFETLYDGN
jgi:hypothetical protein